MLTINKYPKCLLPREVYEYFESFYPNRTIYKNISYSKQTIRCVQLLRIRRISITRIYMIKYHCLLKYFEIFYFKRHYGRTGCEVLFCRFI